MKLNIIALSGLLALAAAQDATSTDTAAATSVSLSPEASCAAKCGANDICCVAECYHVPCPNETMANSTNDCVAACPQGSGSASDTEKYAECQQSCYSSHFFPATQPTATSSGTSGRKEATTTGSDSSSTSSGSSDASESEFDSVSSSSTSTSTGASASQTGAASHVQLGASAACLFGLVLAAFAL